MSGLERSDVEQSGLERSGVEQSGLERSGPQQPGLERFRGRLDEIDEQIAGLLGERFQICREVAAYKSEHDIPMMQPQRVVQVRERYLARGGAVGLPADFTESLFELLIGATCKLEDELMHQPGLEPGSPDFKSGPFTA